MSNISKRHGSASINPTTPTLLEIRLVAGYLRADAAFPSTQPAALIWASQQCKDSSGKFNTPPPGAGGVTPPGVDAANCGVETAPEREGHYAEVTQVVDTWYRLLPSEGEFEDRSGTSAINAALTTSNIDLPDGTYEYASIEMCKQVAKDTGTIRWQGASMGAPVVSSYTGQCQIIDKLDDTVTVSASGDVTVTLELSYHAQWSILPSSATDSSMDTVCSGEWCLIVPEFHADVYLDDGNIVEEGVVFHDHNLDGAKADASSDSPDFEAGIEGARVTLYRVEEDHSLSLVNTEPQPHPLHTLESGQGSGAFAFERYPVAFKANGALLLAPDTVVQLDEDTDYMIFVELSEAMRDDFQPGPGQYAGSFRSGPILWAYQYSDLPQDELDLDVRERPNRFHIAKRTFRTPQRGGGTLPIHVGFVPAFVLGDYVFLDQDRNGLQDGSDSGIDGIEIELWDLTVAGEIRRIATTVSDFSGAFAFPAAKVGLYPNQLLSMRIYLNQPNVVREGNSAGKLIPTKAYARREPDAADDSDLLSTEENVYAQVLITVPGFDEADKMLDFDMGLTTFNCDALGDCSGHGTCADNQQCECTDGWSGNLCELDPNRDAFTSAPATPSPMIPNSPGYECGITGRVLDKCGVCGGNGQSCKTENEKKGKVTIGDVSFDVNIIYALVGALVVVLVIIFIARRRRKQLAKRRMEAMLAVGDVPMGEQYTAAPSQGYPNQNMDAYAAAGAYGPGTGEAGGEYAPSPTQYSELEMQNAAYGAPPTTGSMYATPQMTQYGAPPTTGNAYGSAAYGAPPTVDAYGAMAGTTMPLGGYATGMSTDGTGAYNNAMLGGGTISPTMMAGGTVPAGMMSAGGAAAYGANVHGGAGTTSYGDIMQGGTLGYASVADARQQQQMNGGNPAYGVQW